MSLDKTLALIGVSDQEAAHLRLIVRKAAPDLDHHWLWGGESGADLLIIDARSFAGQMARTRAQGAGLRYAIFSDVPVDGDVLVLRRPLQFSDVVALLNRAGGAVASNMEIEPNDAGFYVRDIGGDTGDADQAHLGAAFDHADAERGLDDMLRAQPLELRSVRDWMRAQQVVAPVAEGVPVSAPGDVAPDSEAPATRKYATRAAMLADTTPHGLRAYLDGDLLGGPARYALPGEPPLVLDPKHKVAHWSLDLLALEPYCRQRWRQCDWQPLTGAELDEVRATQPALPYARLIWLDVLLQSGGQLASHLDPGGTYRLVSGVEIDGDLGQYSRIASAMLQPLRLHEIAAVSGAPMGEVFNVINAYEALGLIEWQPRARRDDGEAPAPSPLDKLRHLFGKS